jgi:flagella basal body P-ring formation protein FlgA
MKLAFFVCTVAACAAPCQPVEGDSILARDVAQIVYAFAAANPSIELGIAPIVGSRRIVSAQELAAWARKAGIEGHEAHTEACFEQATSPLKADQLMPVLRKVFPRANVEILEFGEVRIPRGKLEFTRGGLEPNGVWRGRLIYGKGRSLPVSVRVRITEERSWIEAREVVAAGKPITEDQLAVVTGTRSVLEPPPVSSIEEVIGKKPTRALGPGAPIYAALLITPPQVMRGDKVQVEVSDGGALLQFEAEAENPGHIGDMVFLRNPESGRRFQAKVEGKGKVAIRK